MQKISRTDHVRNKEVLHIVKKERDILHTRQATYVLSNNDARPYNHCCCEKVVSITYSEFVSVDLLIQHAMRMLRIVIYSLPRSTSFFHIISQTAGYYKYVTEHKM